MRHENKVNENKVLSYGIAVVSYQQYNLRLDNIRYVSKI